MSEEPCCDDRPHCFCSRDWSWIDSALADLERVRREVPAEILDAARRSGTTDGLAR